MLPTTSVISPSTAAARLANSRCSGLPAAALRNITAITAPATATSPAAMLQLTVATKPMAHSVARHGGSTFQTSMFSMVKSGVGGGGDAARQRAGRASGEVAGGMAGQMAEEVAPHRAGDGDEGGVADPARRPPQQVVGRDQGDERGEGQPDRGRAIRLRQRVDEELDAVLRPDRAENGQRDGGQDDGVLRGMEPHVAREEGRGPKCVGAEIFHDADIPALGW